MEMMTSAYANKLLRTLEDEKQYWLNLENTSRFYTASDDEEPLIPAYDYAETASMVTKLDEKIVAIKHALNVSNATAKVPVGDSVMSIDQILIRMAQMNRRRDTLDFMRKQLPKTREGQRSYYNKNAATEYRYINYDLDLVKADYESLSDKVLQMQIALDLYNQTVQFEVDI